MKMKLTTLLFGLLLAVGWTNDASAQLKRSYELVPMGAPTKLVNATPGRTSAMAKFIPKMEEEHCVTVETGTATNGMNRAPRRATIAATVTHPFSWYDNYTYTWYDKDGNPHSNTKITEEATDPYQIYYFLASMYITPEIPGILYNDVFEEDTRYPGVGYGWGVSSSNISGNITITTDGSYANLTDIVVYDMVGNALTEWHASTCEYTSSYLYLPSGWSPARIVNGGSRAYGYIQYGGTITIPYTSFGINNQRAVRVMVRARNSRNGYNVTVSNAAGDKYSRNDVQAQKQSLTTTWTEYNWEIANDVTPPTENGYTVFLVKLKEDTTDIPKLTYTRSALVDDMIAPYFESVQLLTDGLRVGEEGDPDVGTVFSYSGKLNKFFFLGKGKTASINQAGTRYFTSQTAPFYTMFEEFSPTGLESGAQITDFYPKMVAGEYYPVVHDCESVRWWKHFFSMTGKAGTEEKSLTNLILYIPDGRSQSGVRTYEENLQPHVGMYAIQLQANAEPSGRNDSTYLVSLDWQSNLNHMVNNDVPQTYELYVVVFDEMGNQVGDSLIYRGNDVNHYEYYVPQYPESYTITYVVKGWPTNATNNPDNGGSFFAWSNFDDVVIPGLFDFLMLARDHYESDFVISEEKNYYRNYLYPTNLAPNTGQTVAQLKQEWPEDQIAKYRLYRDNTGVAYLEVRAVGDKVYYRIRYYEGTQIKTGPNDITVPNYVEIPNE